MQDEKFIAWAMKARRSWKERVDAVSRILETPSSRFIREAVDKEIKRLARTDAEIAQVLFDTKGK